MRRSVAAITVFLAMALAPVRAHAQEDQAKKHYEEATRAYNLGKFEKAIEGYEKAYELKPDAVFLFNIAQSYRLLGNPKQAVFFYKSYLRNSPKAANRAQIEQRIQELEEQMARQAATKEAPPLGTEQPEEGGGEGGEGGEGEGDQGDQGDGRAKIPSPVEAAETGEAEPASAPMGEERGRSRPIYKKWWFWAGLGAVAIGATAVVLATSGDDVGGVPDTHFATTPAF